MKWECLETLAHQVGRDGGGKGKGERDEEWEHEDRKGVGVEGRREDGRKERDGRVLRREK